MQEKFTQLKKHLARIEDLDGARRLLYWDMQTYLPSGSTQTRANQMATIKRLIHQIRTSDEVGSLLEELSTNLDSLDYDSDEASIIRVNWREFQKLVKIPAERMESFTAESTLAYEAWREARLQSDFSIFQPHLEELLDLQREFTIYLADDAENPYDSLIDFHETGMTHAEIDAIFTAVRPQLIDLIQSLRSTEQIDDSMLQDDFHKVGLLELSLAMAKDLGYSFDHGRLDLTPHPFTMGMSYRDVRITTRLQEDYPLFTIMAAIHEAGHAIHRQQCSPDLYQTMTSQYTYSTGESQSRLYEMIIGRSLEFWTHYYPRMQSTFSSLEKVSLDDFYKALNKVEPGFIRVQADPVTYGLHIMLRFELENDLINGNINVADLPEIWNTKMDEYLGVVPDDVSQGVLQDIHWTDMMGYFPTYLLGSIFAVQLWNKLLEEYPQVNEEIAIGSFEFIAQWLAKRIHAHGGKFNLQELAERAVGSPLSSEPFINFLTRKYSQIYGL